MNINVKKDQSGIIKALLTGFLYLVAFMPVNALQNHIGAHDPSSIIKDGDTYWIFTTGDGIYSMTSKDMISWTAAKTPFSKTEFPSWIKTYVPDFAGTFWAPECYYMNGKFYLYYACSTFGSKISCIGLATSPSLNNPEWTDEGVVIISDNSKNFNAIDPDIFEDKEGKLWFVFGSWNTGIKMQELNKSTGKLLNNTIHSIATFNDAENGQIVKNGNYYYLFVNRGLCCQGSKSTYYIQAGRSESPTGPYTGWRNVLIPRGNFIGPGALGHFHENNTEWATYHYYDNERNGAPTLAIGQFIWKDGWPVITLDWLPQGSYKIKNVNSNLVWQSTSCVSDSGTVINQMAPQDLNCQVWKLTPSANGYYYINYAYGDISVQTKSCSSFLGSELQLAPYTSAKCQLFHIERTNVGDYVISTKSGNRVLEVSASSTDEAQPVILSIYSGNNSQKWVFDTASVKVSIKGFNNSEDLFEIFPNPSNNGNFNISLVKEEYQTLIIYNLQGNMVFKELFNSAGTYNIKSELKAGVYIAKVFFNEKSYAKMLLVK